MRKATGLPEEVPAESAPTPSPQERPREAERVFPFEPVANPVMHFDAREVQKRLAEETARRDEEKKAALLQAIRNNLDDLMPDTKDPKE